MLILLSWSQKAGSSDHIQHGDASSNTPPRRFPHVHVQGPWNQYGYDAGLIDVMQLNQNNWTFELTSEWPTEVVFNVWGMNPDGFPDKTRSYGDIDGDQVLDLVPPDSLATNVVKLAKAPGMPYTSWKLELNDGNLAYRMVPSGSGFRQIVVFLLLALVPILSSVLAMWLFWFSFYQVKHNKMGVVEMNNLATISQAKLPFQRLASRRDSTASRRQSISDKGPSAIGLQASIGSANRRTVLIATMEYEIDDWDIKIKIGGLGVMARLMGQNLGHQNLIWVVVSAIDNTETLSNAINPYPPPLSFFHSSSRTSTYSPTLLTDNTNLFGSLVLAAWTTPLIKWQRLFKSGLWEKSFAFKSSTMLYAILRLSSWTL